MRVKFKWQQAELSRIRALTNQQLLQDTIYSSGGDSFDGCFTTRGEWIFGALHSELEARLTEIGFLQTTTSAADKEN